MSEHSTLHAPDRCPACDGELAVTRLSCGSCGTEISGAFCQCRFCRLGEGDLALLEVFLTSRGNLREVEKHLQVSYPTARARFNDLLTKLGLNDEPEPNRTREQILAEVAAGRLDPTLAQQLLVELARSSS